MLLLLSFFSSDVFIFFILPNISSFLTLSLSFLSFHPLSFRELSAVSFRPSGSLKKIPETELKTRTSKSTSNKSGIKVHSPRNNQLEPIIRHMDTKKLKETLELLICQLEKTESEIEKQHLKIELKKKTKHYEL